MLTFSVARADLQRVSAIPAIWERTLQQAAYKIAVKSATALQVDAPKDTSQTTTSIRPYAIASGAEVRVNTNYAGFIHDGRKPGKMPFKKDGNDSTFLLADWAKRRGIPEKDWFALGRHIAQKGTRPQPWVSDFVKSVRMRQMVNKVLRDAVV